jgi:subtilisin-like proprotein convertase family protein
MVLVLACTLATRLLASTTGGCNDGNPCTDDAHELLPACDPDLWPPFANPSVVPIPDNGTLATTVSVSGVGAYLFDLDLQTFLRHTSCQDLDVTLRSPAGTVVTITSDNGGTLDHVFNGTVWSDEADPGNQAPFPAETFAASSLATDTVYANNVVKSALVPEEALAAFIGEDPNGTWTLTVTDDLAFQTGSLEGWSLSLATVPHAPLESQASFVSGVLNLPIVDAVVSSTIPVTTSGTALGMVTLTTMIEHTRCDQLDVTLRSPGGTVVTLVSDLGATHDHVFDGTTWSDDADPGNEAPFPGNTFSASLLATDTVYTNNVEQSDLVAVEALGAFRGEDPNGTWTLTIVDDDTATDTGLLSRWSLTLATVTCVGDCQYVPDNTNRCDSDGDPCTDLCQNASCVTGQVPPGTACDDGQVCTVGDACNAGGQCLGAPNTCNDFNDCTDDSCHPVGGCSNSPDAGNNCSDEDLCTLGDDCNSLGECVATPVVCPSDNNVCTLEFCNPANGQCANAPDPEATTCSDGSACTQGDLCQNGACVGNPITCNDGDACTTDGCSAASGCFYTPGTAPVEVQGVRVHKPPGPTPISFVSQDVPAGASTSYDVVTGQLSQLLGDAGYAQASCLGTFPDTPAQDGSGTPPAGQGRYYLVRARNGCGTATYGNAGVSPDPRDALDAAGPCP